MKKVNPNYGTSQDTLYAICTSAWEKCSEYLPQFKAIRVCYVDGFIAAQQQAVEEAKTLPSTVQTVTNRKLARMNLVAATKQLQDDWQLLKKYVVKAYDKIEVKTRLDAAGASFYNKASVDNWSGVRRLMDAANIFIAANSDDLMANQNMPPAFVETFQNDSVNCIKKAAIFFDMNMGKQVSTSTKIDANNAIYASVIEMLKDGQQIFKDDAAIKKQFIFSRLVSVYKGEGSARLRGRITNELNLPVEGVSIISIDQKYFATTDAKGRYRINRIAEGSYLFTITCPGYTPVDQVITFTAGTGSKANFELASVMKKVA